MRSAFAIKNIVIAGTLAINMSLVGAVASAAQSADVACKDPNGDRETTLTYPLTDPNVLEKVKSALKANYPDFPSFEVEDRPDHWIVEVTSCIRGRRQGGVVTLMKKDLAIVDVVFHQ